MTLFLPPAVCLLPPAFRLQLPCATALRVIFPVMSNNRRVLLFITDKELMKTLTEDLRRSGYLVDRCENLETCEHVNSFYDHDIAFLQADDDDLETIQAAAGFVTPGARLIVIMEEPDAEITEKLEMQGIQVVPRPRDSITLVELLEEDTEGNVE